MTAFQNCGTKSTSEARMKRPKLTRRDLDLIRLGALGLSDKGIAEELGIAPRTVTFYFSKLRMRLGNFERGQLAGLGLLLGLVSIADITREALQFLQRFEFDPPPAPELPSPDREGAD